MPENGKMGHLYILCHPKLLFYPWGNTSILQPQKTPGGFIGCIGADPQNISNSMRETAASFKKDSGVRLRHMVLSFAPSEISSPEVAYQIGCDIIAHNYGDYQAAFAVHQYTPNLHIHFVFNSVSYTDGHQYYGKRREYYSLVNSIAKILRGYGIPYLNTASRRLDVDVQFELE